MNHDRHVFFFRSLLEETKLIKIFKGIVFDEQRVANLWNDKLNPHSWRNEKKGRSYNYQCTSLNVKHDLVM